MTKEEFSQKHNELVDKRDALNDTYKVYYNKMQNDIKKVLDTFKPSGTTVNYYININSSNELSCEVAFVKENGKDDFGSNFRVYLEKRSTYDTYRYEVQMSQGTIGTYTKEDVYQIYRLEFMLNLWKSVDFLQEELIKIINNKEYQENDKAYREIMRELDHLELDWDYQVRENIRSSLAIGKKYQTISEGLSDCWTITKITPQFVWYDYSFKIGEDERFCKDRKIRKEQFVGQIYRGQLEPIE